MVLQQGLGVTDVLFGSNKDKGNHSLHNKGKGGITFVMLVKSEAISEVKWLKMLKMCVHLHENKQLVTNIVLFSSLRFYLAVTVRGLLYQVGGSFTSWLLTVLSLPAPCLPTSSLGSFLSLSPSIRTRTTPDLSTISWIILPFLPMTLPVVKERKSLGKNTWADFQNLCWANVCPQMNCIQNSKRNVSNKQLTYKVPWNLEGILLKLQIGPGLLHSLWGLESERTAHQNHCCHSPYMYLYKKLKKDEK